MTNIEHVDNAASNGLEMVTDFWESPFNLTLQLVRHDDERKVSVLDSDAQPNRHWKHDQKGESIAGDVKVLVVVVVRHQVVL